ncbi:MAG TPA: hypothetical protein VIJ92_10415 [Ginsengibacter sp.]
MHSKMIISFFLFSLLFSLHGFSQATEPSAHPLLDKYYPRAQVVDTNKTVGTQITSSQIKPASAGTTITTSPKNLIVTTTQADTTTRSAANIPSMTTKPAITSTTAVNTPNTIVRNVPAVPVQQPAAPPSQPYRDTRLGSSTPQYDTWQKNDNGAGAVTTSPK